MKPSAYLINTSRGPMVDEAALLAVLRDKKIAGAGLDVFDVEPLPLDHPLRKMDNVVITPHLGYVSEQNYRHYFRRRGGRHPRLFGRQAGQGDDLAFPRRRLLLLLPARGEKAGDEGACQLGSESRECLQRLASTATLKIADRPPHPRFARPLPAQRGEVRHGRKQ